eukprot:TRINITY_DN24907_c3_g1_i1.p1 TRINITY_DN24907_c3_g1~~TRINITY_DN24907_c3_g1_i1.p1  ORF type:complete len:683 (-),score=99.33 TRINITY_DN24907_c3_g1_i1:166-2214(-)
MSNSASGRFHVSASASDGTSFEQVAIANGVKAWQDNDSEFTAVPERLLGGTLLRIGHATLSRDAVLVVNVAGAEARIYVGVETQRKGAEPRHGGLSVALANLPRWISEDGAPSYGDGSAEMAMFSTFAPSGAIISLPATTEAGAVLILVVVPVVTGSFAVSVVSNTKSSQQESLAVVEEGVIAWRDRDHRYTNVPNCLLGGALYQGPHKDVPEGCVICVRPNLQSRIYVATERACSGGLIERLPADGWSPEDEAPQWHDVKTMMMFSRDCIAGGALTLPPTRGSGTVFSIFVVPNENALIAPVEVSCATLGTDSASAADAGEPARLEAVAPPWLSLVPMAEGVPLWHDANDRKLSKVPEWMCGSTLVRCSSSGPPATAILTVRVAAPSVVYTIVEADVSSSGGVGLVPALLAAGWERRDEAPQILGGPSLAVYAKRVASWGAVSLPPLPAARAVAAIAIKVDVEAFEACVETSQGLQFTRTPMAESVVIWSDRLNRFAWVSDNMVGGILFRGPHDTTPSGTTIRVRASAAFRAYVIVESKHTKRQACTGGFPTSLLAAGWRKESGGPSWGDTASTMEIYSRRALDSEELLLPPTNGATIFSVVVVGLSGNNERLAEELKYSFTSWDADGKGAISRTDLDQLMRAFCPGLSDDGRETLLKHADRAGTGRIDYSEFADSLMLAS